MCCNVLCVLSLWAASTPAASEARGAPGMMGPISQRRRSPCYKGSVAAAREPPSQGQQCLLLVLRSPQQHTPALGSEMPVLQCQCAAARPKETAYVKGN